MDIQRNIREGKYKVALQYPCSELYPTAEEREKMRAEYREEQVRLNRQFQADLLEAYGMTNHPKREAIWNMAYGRGHSAGYHEVAQEFDELMALITKEVAVFIEVGNLVNQVSINALGVCDGNRDTAKVPKAAIPVLEAKQRDEAKNTKLYVWVLPVE